MSARGAVLLTLLALAAPAFAQAPDPAATGPHAVTTQEYTQGDTAFTPAGFPAPVEFTGAVFHPTDLANGPYPLVLYLHGRHGTCVGAFEWPCTGGRAPIRSYRGYNYSGQQLASHGYIVISVSANGINARDNGVNDLGAAARAELIDRHLQFWRTLNTTGAAPFGTQFVGRVDLSRVGTMGHSRGGEGVMRHFSFNAGRPSPFPLKMIVPIAPTNFSRWQVNQNVAVAQLLSYCDGDVSDLQGVHYYDDARYRMTGGGYQNYITVMGANHNFFNTVWTPPSAGASDDWGNSGDPHCGSGAGNGRLSAANQRAVGQAYLATFFRTEVGGESGFFGYIDGSAGKPPTVSALSLHTSYQGNDSQRRDLNRLLAAGDLTTDFLGGASSQTGLSPHDLCGGDSPQPQHCLASQSTSRMPHTTPSARSSLRGMSQLRTGWSATSATYLNQIPAGAARDVSDFDFFQFRASVNFADTRNPGGTAQDLSVRSTDAGGGSQTLRVGQFSGALFFPPGTQGPVPKVLQNTVRLPLSSLTAVDLTRVSEVAFLFNQRSSGALLLSDLHFYRGAGAPPTPTFNIAATPAERSVTQGGSTTYTATVTPFGGFSGTVNLAVSGLPAGATGTFNPTSIAGGSGSSTLTVATASTTPTGRFTLTLTGTSGSIQRTATVVLEVLAGGAVVFFDNFETDLGWVRNPSATDTATTGLWVRGNPEDTSSSGPKQLGTTVSGVNDLVTGRLAGASVGADDIDGGTTSIRSPTITLSGGTSFTLTFNYYFSHLNNSSSADFLRVRIVGSSTTTVFQELGSAADDDAVWASATVNLDAFAGQTVRILIEAADASGASLVEAAVDDVRVTRN